MVINRPSPIPHHPLEFTQTMLPEVRQIEAQLKQILYGCVEHVQATKAALYLSTSHDLNDKKYELVTSYQYNPADRKVLTANDDLVDRLAVKRNAFFVNGLSADQRFSEILFRQGNDRLLAAPLFSRGRLLGFIDMRDKAGKKPFESPDVEAARKIAEDMLGVLASNKLFGLGPLTVVQDAAPRIAIPISAPSPMSPAAMQPQPQQQPGTGGPVFSPAAIHAIDAARTFMARRQLTSAAPTASTRRTVTDTDLDVVRLLLPSALSIPGAVIASLSAVGQTNNPQATVAAAQVSDDALETLAQHLQAWLKRANQPHMTARPQPVFPFGAQVVPVTAAGISTILTAPVNPQSIDGLVLTVAFERTAEATAQRFMHVFLKQIEGSVDGALATGAGRVDRMFLAERLLEPDFAKYPDLLEHCREVSVIAHRFARALDLQATQVETVRIAALVHDIGLRLLDYERMYRRPSLTAEELRGLAEHPVVGAALVEPLLGADVAQAVLRHHERVDGKGYPSRLPGSQIPLAARIIPIADAWVAMTSRLSYQMPVGRDQAIARLKEGAGTQFDGGLVERFLGRVSEIVT